MSSWMPFWATSNPSRSSDSGTSTAPPSTMMIASSEPATTISTSEYSSCSKVGLRIQLPWIRPRRIPATRVSKGIFDMFSERDAPMIAHVSALFS